jgi:hypothetical protein
MIHYYLKRENISNFDSLRSVARFLKIDRKKIRRLIREEDTHDAYTIIEVPYVETHSKITLELRETA